MGILNHQSNEENPQAKGIYILVPVKYIIGTVKWTLSHIKSVLGVKAS